MNEKQTEKMEGAITHMINDILEGTNVYVVGVGGCGCNTVEYITKQKMANVKTMGINTDKNVVNGLDVNVQMLIGGELTKGEGTQGDSNLGKRAAELNEEQILNALDDADMVVIVAGLGGGTGSSASKIIAELARRNGKLVVSYAIMPFSAEEDRHKKAKKHLKELSWASNATTVFENDKLVKMYADKPINEAMKLPGRMLHQLVNRLQMDCLVEFFQQCGVSTETQNEIYSEMEPELSEHKMYANAPMIKALGYENGSSKEYEIPRLDSFLENYSL